MIAGDNDHIDANLLSHSGIAKTGIGSALYATFGGSRDCQRSLNFLPRSFAKGPAWD